MGYILAKRLKDAGFPMEEWVYHKDGSREPYIPSLSELIEACGDGMFRLNATLVCDLRAEGWKIARSQKEGDYYYYLIWKPGKTQEVHWPENITDGFIRRDGEIFYGD